MAELKIVYAAEDEQTTLNVFSKLWDKEYSKNLQSCRENWLNLSAYFKHPQKVRRLINAANTIASFNRQF